MWLLAIRSEAHRWIAERLARTSLVIVATTVIARSIATLGIGIMNFSEEWA